MIVSDVASPVPLIKLCNINRLKEAKAQYDELKQQAKENAEAAAHSGAVIAFWSFLGLLAGAIISTLAGLWGGNTHPVHRKMRS